MTELERRVVEMLDASEDERRASIDNRIDARRAELRALDDDALIARADARGTISHAQLTMLTCGSATAKESARRVVCSVTARNEVLTELTVETLEREER